MKTLMIIASAVGLISPAYSMDFMMRTDCLVEHPGKVGLHTTCLVTGGMSDGSIDALVRIPDGHKYLLEDFGPGSITLAGNKAQKSTDNPIYGRCYRTTKIGICFGERIE